MLVIWEDEKKDKSCYIAIQPICKASNKRNFTKLSLNEKTMKHKTTNRGIAFSIRISDTRHLTSKCENKRRVYIQKVHNTKAPPLIT